jgi:hypothetical protein
MAGNRNERFDPLSNQLDLIWSGSPTTEKNSFNSYYDYFFSGEDIKVYIDGLFSEEYELDIAALSYNIRQEKQPLYGFWSYNYDAMMYGTRIITGEFSIYTRYPRRMTDLIEEAARARTQQPDPRKDDSLIKSTLRNIDYGSSSSSVRSLQDEKNIQKYWAYSQLDRISTDPFSKNVVDSDKNIFSAHPPFNFIILYGVEEISTTAKDYLKAEDKVIESNLDRMMISDVNERLIKPNTNNQASPMKIVLQEIQLMSMTTAYASGGSPLVENYQFMARDYYFSEVDLGFIKNTTTNNSSDEPTVSLFQNGVATQTATNYNSSSRNENPNIFL